VVASQTIEGASTPYHVEIARRGSWNEPFAVEVKALSIVVQPHEGTDQAPKMRKWILARDTLKALVPRNVVALARGQAATRVWAVHVGEATAVDAVSPNEVGRDEAPTAILVGPDVARPEKRRDRTPLYVGQMDAAVVRATLHATLHLHRATTAHGTTRVLLAGTVPAFRRVR
jgi:hypothetical protein